MLLKGCTCLDIAQQLQAVEVGCATSKKGFDQRPYGPLPHQTCRPTDRRSTAHSEI